MPGPLSRKLAIGFLTVLAAAGGGLVALTIARRPHATSVMRGHAIAQRLGCFTCHGPEGSGGARDIRSIDGELPSFLADATRTFYIQGSDDMREWILNGRSKRPSPIGYPRPLIAMPAYGDILSARELDDLEAYVRAVAALHGPLPPKVAQGKEIASRSGCFTCHGLQGRGFSSNPGSFKGFIPPWDGEDFKEVVRDQAELREWILNGKIRRFESNPLARYFTHGQKIQMPAYRELLKSDELEAVLAYINWLRIFKLAEPSAPQWTEPEAKALLGRVQYGKWLYQRSGCAVCHGRLGESKIPNPNAFGGRVPPLNNLAEQMNILEKKDANTFVAALDRGTRVEDMARRPPIPHFDSVLANFKKYRDVILKGSAPLDQNSAKTKPPVQMPGWSRRRGADGGPSSASDIDAILAYLLTLQSWD